MQETRIKQPVRRSLSTVAVALCLCLPTVAGGDTGADFYQPPSPLPPGEPGDVIRVRPARAGPPSARDMADAWQVLYRSTDALGEPMAVTGTVLVPKDADSDRPLIGLAPGTQGPSFRCAPSSMIDQGAFYEQPAINDMLKAGYAVAVPDYEGYRPDPETTYMVGPSMGAALTDAVRAAQRLNEAELAPDAPVIFRGYSQGGGAALWAAEMQPEYAPELNLLGVAGGGVPGNLARVALPLDGQAGFGVMLYALLGQDHAYPELSLAPFLNQAGTEALADMQDGMCVLELLQSFAGDQLSDYTDTSPIGSERLQRIDENTLGRRSLLVPLFLYHEEQDGVVDFAQAENLRQTYCDQGSTVRWRSYDTDGETGIARHINLVYRANDPVETFIEQRLAGEPVKSDCS